MNPDDIDSLFNKQKNEKLDKRSKKLYMKYMDYLYKYFDKKLDWEDFIRNYSAAQQETIMKYLRVIMR